jgi:hypothetical protein
MADPKPWLAWWRRRIEFRRPRPHTAFLLGALTGLILVATAANLRGVRPIACACFILVAAVFTGLVVCGYVELLPQERTRWRRASARFAAICWLLAVLLRWPKFGPAIAGSISAGVIALAMATVFVFFPVLGLLALVQELVAAIQARGPARTHGEQQPRPPT